MQNYNNPVQPQGGYGQPPPPPPAPKKGLSTGVKILIVCLVVVVVGGVVLVAAGIGGIYLLSRRAQESVSHPALAGLADTSGADAAEPPEPTAEQQSAIAGGQSAEWPQQEISWTVPQRWKKFSAEGMSFMWRSPGSFDAASLIVTISPLSADFPAETSVNAFYTGAEQRKRSGEVSEVRWLKLDGVAGVMFRESAPENADNPQRLQWIGSRTYKGQKQLINIMLASRGKDFASHEDAMYGILYSTKLGQ
jgi:hypothetical protein